MSGIITFIKKAGERFAGAIRAVARPEVPQLYIERMAARKIIRKAFESHRVRDAARAVATTVKTSARATIAHKRYENKIAEQLEYELGLTYTQRMKRRSLRRAQLAAMEKASLAKRTYKKSLRDYIARTKKITFKEREFDRTFGKTATRIRKEIIGRERSKEQFEAELKRIKKIKPQFRKGWYVFYQIGRCNHSLPCDPEEDTFYWIQQVEKTEYWHPTPKPNLDTERDRILSRGNYQWATKNWRLVYVK